MTTKTITMQTDLAYLAMNGHEVIEHEVINGENHEDFTLNGARVANTLFETIIFRNCLFFGTHFSEVDFLNCKFENCSFQFSHIKDCTVEGSSFKNCEWHACSISRSSIANSLLDADTAIEFAENDSNIWKPCFSS